jgi:Fic family protein
MTNDRKYKETHPWLTFNANLKAAGPELWMMLGECQSKCEHLSRVPLRPDVAKELHRMYMVKGVLATTAIEGNTLSEEEVEKILEGKSDLPPSREYLGQEVKNIIDECNRILDDVAVGKHLELSSARIKELDGKILEKLQLEDWVIPGEIRRNEVGVGLYKGAPAEDCEFLLDELCKWLNDSTQFGLPTDNRAIVFAIIKAILAHLYLAWIHPFGDGNGRTARLVEFQILISSGLPAPAAHLLSNHYYLTRNEYYRQLNQASKSGGDVLPFITYAVQGFLDGLKMQLNAIREQVLDFVWHTYVFDQFLDKTKPADLRRRDLIEDLSRMVEPKAVSFDQLPLISPRVASAYAKKTGRTLSRDIAELYKMKLITFDKGLIRANKEEFLAFLPTQLRVPAPEEKPKRKKKAA